MPAFTGLLELRRYRLHPGRRDELADLFARELAEPQAADGMQVLGQFADADEPDHFVWLRGYPDPDPEARARALASFYGGPVWAANRDAANATMVDSDDVLLLRPAGTDVWAGALAGGPAIVATTCLLDAADGAPERALGALRAAGDERVAPFATADVPNLYPALPVRDDRAIVWLEASGDDDAARAARRERLARVVDALGPALREAPHVATLVPTPASLLPLEHATLWIRPAGEHDVGFLHGLAQRAYEHYVPRIGGRPGPMDSDYAAAVRAGQAFVAEDDGGPVGLLVLVVHDDHLLVENVAVEPGRQGAGIGRALLELADRRARALGLPELRLYTHAKMTENRRLYARRGYREVDRRDDEGFDRVFFAKPTPGLR